MAVKFATNSLNLLGASHYLPKSQISNAQLYAWIAEHCGQFAARKAQLISRRLGIQGRHFSRNFASQEQPAWPNGIDMAQHVLEHALRQAKLDVNQLDYLLSHTCTPHTQVPPNAAWLADNTAYQGPYLELRQACTGFANGLQVASAICAADQSPVAIVGSEVGSAYFQLNKDFVDQQQLVNFMQMGDGSGGVIVGPANSNRRLIKDIYLGQIGQDRQPGFSLDSGAGNVHQGKMGRFHHEMKAVREAGPKLYQLGLNSVLSRGYKLDDFRYILPHQANGHIDQLLGKALNFPQQQIINDAKELGNLGSAAIWVSFSRLLNTLPLKQGDQVLVLGAEATKYLYGGFVYQH